VQADSDAGRGRLPIEEAVNFELYVMRIVKTIARLVEQFWAACTPTSRRIAGLGKFSSGVPDLASSKNHLRNFGHGDSVLGEDRNK
jgi:hypothetical protein